MGERRKARELAIQVLFHLEFSPENPSQGFELICENFYSPKNARAFARELVLGVCQNRSVLDQMISKASKNWRIERMPRLDRTILRLAVFEMLFMDQIPLKVSLDEAIELGNRYGSEDSGRYINGVLDHIYNEIYQEERPYSHVVGSSFPP